MSDKGLQALRRRAEELALSRRETTSTAHLLAAVAELENDAASLVLLDRGLDAVRVLDVVPTERQDAGESISRTLQRARDFASRGESKAATPLHVLFALCQERNSGAYRILEGAGLDVAKLRATVMQLAMGIVTPRRTTPITEPRVSRTTIATAGSSARPPAPAPLRTPKASPFPEGRPSSRISRRDAAFRPPSDELPTLPTPQQSEALPGSRTPAPEVARPTILAACTRAFAREPARVVVGRAAEVERILDALDRRDAHHAVIVGTSGIRKSAVLDALAAALDAGGTRVLTLEPAPLVAGAMARGAMTERFARLRRELESLSGRTVLVVDGLGALLGADASEETVAEVRGLLAKGATRLVFTATPEDFRRHVEPDAAMLRRLTVIELAELPRARVVEVVERVASDLAAHHAVNILPAAREACISWAERYVSERVFPDKALTILDLAAARAKRKRAASVERSHVAQVVSDLAAVPLDRLLETDAERMLHLEDHLARRVVGHTDALTRLARVLRRSASGLRAERPLGSFLLLGPTGVGKTETAKAVAECLFGSPHAMTRLDFSEYAEAHAVARLVGAPPGYVGHDAGGQLTEAVRKRAYQVILLDEVEKAHRDVLEALLQVLDEGRMTDGRGRTVDFRQTVLVLTSNLGAEAFAKGAVRAPIGFGGAIPNAEDPRGAALEKAKAALPPELVNRFDDVLVFGTLTESDVRDVAARMLRDLATRLGESRKVDLSWTDAVLDHLMQHGGFDVAYGARPMRRAIGRLVETPLAEHLLAGSLHAGGKVRLEVRDDAIHFTTRGGKEKSRAEGSASRV